MGEFGNNKGVLRGSVKVFPELGDLRLPSQQPGSLAFERRFLVGGSRFELFAFLNADDLQHGINGAGLLADGIVLHHIVDVFDEGHVVVRQAVIRTISRIGKLGGLNLALELFFQGVDLDVLGVFTRFGVSGTVEESWAERDCGVFVSCYVKSIGSEVLSVLNHESILE